MHKKTDTLMSVSDTLNIVVIIIIIIIIISDATVWKFKSRIGFRLSSSQNRNFSFQKKIYIFLKWIIEIAVLISVFGLEAKTAAKKPILTCFTNAQ